MTKFTPRQQLFVNEYLKDLNATQAAMRAGYSEKSAGRFAQELLSKVHIKQAVTEAIEARNRAVGIDAQYVLQRLLDIDQMDILDIMNDDFSFRPLGEWPRVWRQFMSGMENVETFAGRGDDRTLTGYIRKIKWPDKARNLELIGKHVNVQAFNDKLDLTTKNDALNRPTTIELVVPDVKGADSTAP